MNTANTHSLYCSHCQVISHEDDCAVLIMDMDPSTHWALPIVTPKQIETHICPVCGSEDLCPVEIRISYAA
jgi:RNA polymerase subunit RPABC4/transcription elongation factor Spt4